LPISMPSILVHASSRPRLDDWRTLFASWPGC
jgi:hypothetical protein